MTMEHAGHSGDKQIIQRGWTLDTNDELSKKILKKVSQINYQLLFQCPTRKPEVQ